MSDPKVSTTHPAYYRLGTRDSAGNTDSVYASFLDGHFVLFQVQDGAAQVMYLFAAATALDIPQVVSQNLIDVTGVQLLDKPPEVQGAVLSASHPWPPADRARVGALLETKDVKMEGEQPAPGPQPALDTGPAPDPGLGPDDT